ncbi:MAG TPA: HPr family phosphocarrier protein [bacterium]|nr:HPr family phosphocarrier protein [bacterium]
MPETQKEKEKSREKEKEKDRVYEKKVVIRNKLGLHARPAALFVQTANRFQSDVQVSKGRQKVNGKSIMGIMTLAVGAGSAITIRTEGVDAAKAMAELNKLISSNFGGEE